MGNFKTGDEISRILRRERRIREGVQPVLESGVDVKTINGETIVGPGNLDVAGGGGPSAPTDWGEVTGNLAEQVDLKAALDAKQDTLVSGSNVKTVNGNSLLGSGNISISGGYAEGTSFPGSPTTNQKFYRTDLNWLCFYDGTRWLTCQEFSEPIALAGKVFISAVPDASGYLSVRKDYQLYITTMTNSIRVSSTSNGSNFWTINLLRYNSSSATSTVHTFNTSTLTAGVYTNMKQTINAPLDASAFFLSVEFAKTGSPGLLGIFSSLQYRLIVT